MTALRLIPPEEENLSDWDIFERWVSAHDTRAGERQKPGSLAENPPGASNDEDQAAEQNGEEGHALLSKILLASWIGWVAFWIWATAPEALHCATTSRAQFSQRPH
jgi:hypothetical protein